MMDSFKEGDLMKENLVCVLSVGLVASALILTGCKTKSHAGQEAKKGASYGALGGATSGFFSGLFNGEPLQRAAQGAVVGGATGATMGAVRGSVKDRDLKAEYGEINYKGLMALVERNYPQAKEYAAQSANDPHPKYRKASAWLSALIAKETLAVAEMPPYYATLVTCDPDIATVEDATAKVRLAERDLKALRKQLSSQ